MDLASNNLQRLICHETQATNLQPTMCCKNVKIQTYVIKQISLYRHVRVSDLQ